MKDVKVEKLSGSQKDEKQIKSWSIWEKEVSRFEWEYDSDEECYILNGEVRVESEEGEILIKAGDFVTFSKGLKCIWDIKTPIKKHYNFK